jgi:hypothetical protein
VVLARTNAVMMPPAASATTASKRRSEGIAGTAAGSRRKTSTSRITVSASTMICVIARSGALSRANRVAMSKPVMPSSAIADTYAE